MDVQTHYLFLLVGKTKMAVANTRSVKPLHK